MSSTPLATVDRSRTKRTAPRLAESERIGVVIQGPIQVNLNGHATREVVEALAKTPLRSRLFVVYAMWEDEPAVLRDTIVPLVDRVVLCKKPPRSGSCHRNYQAYAVQQGLRELERNGIAWALKTRSDLVLSTRFLALLLSRAESPEYDRVLVTNLYTRYEPFHISDIVVFSSTMNLLDWFNPASVFYEDLFSPEVQFTRVFIRRHRLDYPMTLSSYLRFLRDWIELVDFYEQELFWFKDGGSSIELYNRSRFILYDRDAGPVLTRLISVRFHRSLRQKAKGLNLLATYLLVSDAIQRYVFTVLPGFRHRHATYTVDNQGSEHTKSITNGDPVFAVEPVLERPFLPSVRGSGYFNSVSVSQESAAEVQPQ